MRDPFARSFVREADGALLLGAIITIAVVLGLSVFSQQDSVLMAENTVTEPVTEDTPGPVVRDRMTLDDAGERNATPLSDKER